MKTLLQESPTIKRCSSCGCIVADSGGPLMPFYTIENKYTESYRYYCDDSECDQDRQRKMNTSWVDIGLTTYSENNSQQ